MNVHSTLAGNVIGKITLSDGNVNALIKATKPIRATRLGSFGIANHVVPLLGGSHP